jgi:hypothetical protein
MNGRIGLDQGFEADILFRGPFVVGVFGHRVICPSFSSQTLLAPAAQRRFNFLAIHCPTHWPIFAERRAGVEMGSQVSWRERGQFLSCAVMRRRRGRPMRPEPPLPWDVRRLAVSMAQVTVAWSMSEDHRADRKDRRANPNDNGGLLLGYDWRRFHDQE